MKDDFSPDEIKRSWTIFRSCAEVYRLRASFRIVVHCSILFIKPENHRFVCVASNLWGADKVIHAADAFRAYVLNICVSLQSNIYGIRTTNEVVVCFRVYQSSVRL